MFTKIKNISTAVFFTGTVESKKQRLYLWLILILALTVRLAVFYNTTIFSFSDFKEYYTLAFKIAGGVDVALFSPLYPLVISHIAGWFIKNLGTINYWFYCNIALSALSVITAWMIIKKVTGHGGIANLSVLIIALYPFFIIQPSVFYTQVVMVFCESLIFLLLLLAFDCPRRFLVFVYILLSSLIVISTMLFKWELLYLYIFMFACSIILFFLKYKKQALVLLLFSVFSFVFLQLTVKYYEPIQPQLKYGDNFLFFFGQTLYSGGEGVMLEEYKQKYDEGYEEFSRLHKGEYEREVLMRNDYHKMLIKEFIMNHPFEWAGLQVKKFFRTLGIKPEGLSFRLLVSGKMPVNKGIAGGMLSFPFIVLLLGCIFLFDRDIVRRLFKSYRGWFMFTLLIYFLAATIFYPHYQIRYRMPLEFFFIIPAACAFFISAVSNGNTIKAVIKKHLIWKLVVFLIFLSAWAYEAYDIFYLNSARYLKNADQYEQGIIK